jgi:hypothetical protein
MQPFGSLSGLARRAVEMATDALSDDEHAAEFLLNLAKRDPVFRTEVFGNAQPEIGPLRNLVEQCRRATRM